MELKTCITGIVSDGSRLLLVDEDAFWNAPNGKIRAGELIEVAVKRVVKESTGVGVRVEKLVSAFVDSNSLSGKTNKWNVVLAYLAYPENYDVKPCAKWCDLKELPRMNLQPDIVMLLKKLDLYKELQRTL